MAFYLKKSSSSEHFLTSLSFTPTVSILLIFYSTLSKLFKEKGFDLKRRFDKKAKNTYCLMTSMIFFPLLFPFQAMTDIFTLDCQAMRTPTDELSISSSQCYKKPCCLPLILPINLSIWHSFCSCYEIHGDCCCTVEIRRTESESLGIHGMVLSTAYSALENNKKWQQPYRDETDPLTFGI